MKAVTIHDDRELGGGHVLACDLIDILQLVQVDAAGEFWRCSNVECFGDLADELHGISDAGSVVSSSEMLRLAAGVYQIVDGDFEARHAPDLRPWLVVRAIDSSLYVIITDDEDFLARVRERFRDVRDSPLDAMYVA